MLSQNELPLFAQLSYTLGLRRSELLLLRSCDIFHNCISIPQVKVCGPSTRRIAPLPEELAKKIGEYIRLNCLKPYDRLFQLRLIQDEIMILSRKKGIKSLHDLRKLAMENFVNRYCREKDGA